MASYHINSKQSTEMQLFFLQCIPVLPSAKLASKLGGTLPVWPLTSGWNTPMMAMVCSLSIPSVQFGGHNI